MAPSIVKPTVRRVKGLRLRQAKVAGQREGPAEVLPEVWRIVMMLADLSSLAGEMRTWLTVSAAAVRGRASAHRLIASNFPKQNDQHPISIRNWCMSHNHDAIHVHTIAATVFIVTRSRPQPQGIVGGASFHLACG